MASLWPYSHISTVHGTSFSQSNGFMLATAGARLLVSTLEDSKQYVAEWNAYEEVEEDSRAAKRQRVEQRSRKPTNIILLATSHADEHFVAVTEDKCVHVLSLSESHQIVELSRRSMPKRPCAIQILVEERLLLCADKFGDVYSLPMIPDVEKDAKYVNGDLELQAQVEQEEEKFKPSATALTVHTLRNLKALENQQRQTNFTTRKRALAFEHQLLLGHVSMLTDLAFVKSPSDHGRIITADRDEHIRISRGPSQAHVIEGYCLGHTDFISRLCPIPASTLVISGGGEDWLGIWDWSTCRLQGKIELKRALVEAGVDIYDKLQRITVSKMKCLTKMHRSSATATNVLLVLCERVKALVLVTLHKGAFVGIHVEKLTEIPLDVVGFEDNIVVSVDVRTTLQKRLLSYALAEYGKVAVLKLCIEEQYAVQQLNKQKTTLYDEQRPDELLYYIANFRKRGGWEEPKPRGEEQEDIDGKTMLGDADEGQPEDEQDG